MCALVNIGVCILSFFLCRRRELQTSNDRYRDVFHPWKKTPAEGGEVFRRIVASAAADEVDSGDARERAANQYLNSLLCKSQGYLRLPRARQKTPRGVGGLKRSVKLSAESSAEVIVDCVCTSGRRAYLVWPNSIVSEFSELRIETRRRKRGRERYMCVVFGEKLLVRN